MYEEDNILRYYRVFTYPKKKNKKIDLLFLFLGLFFKIFLEKMFSKF